MDDVLIKSRTKTLLITLKSMEGNITSVTHLTMTPRLVTDHSKTYSIIIEKKEKKR